jgi:hypothetical protein
MQEDEDSAPLSAEESLSLIAQQNQRMRRVFGGAPARILAAWAIAYFAGWGVTYAAALPGSAVPGWVIAVVMPIGFLGAIIATAYYGIQASRGIRGPSRRIGRMYGWSWAFGFVGLWVINTAILRATTLPTEVLALLWSGSSLLVVGLLYLAGGMVFADRLMYGLGGWMIFTAAISVLVGYPATYLVLCLCGGGGFLLASIGYFAREFRR